MIIHALLVVLIALGLFTLLTGAFIGVWLLFEKAVQRREQRRRDEETFRNAVNFAKWDAQVEGGPWWDELTPQLRRERKRLPGCEP